MDRFAIGLVALASAVVAGACGDVEPPPMADGGGQATPQAEVVLGGTDFWGDGFLPLEGPQTLVPGAQGGFHLWVKFRVSSMPPRRVKVRRIVRRISDDRLILTTSSKVDIGLPADQGYWELPQAFPSFICPSPIGVNVVGERVRVELSLSDEDETVVFGRAEAEVTLVCPEGDQVELCQEICTG